MMSESTSRWIAAWVLFLLTLLGGTVPFYLINWYIQRRRRKQQQQQQQTPLPVLSRRRQDASSSGLGARPSATSGHMRMMSFLTQLGGGVLFYTALIHMLPEVRDNFEDLVTKSNHTSGVPLGFLFWGVDTEQTLPPIVDLFVCLGFFGIFAIEQFAHSLLKNHSHSHDGEPTNREAGKEDAKNGAPSSSTHKSIGLAPLNKQEQSQRDADSGEYSSGTKVDSGEIDEQPEMEELEEESAEPGKLPASAGRTVLDCALLILAFSCHALFDGIAIGVQRGSRIWSLLIAILSHKLLIAFVLCHQVYVRAMASGSKRLATIALWLFGVVFAALSPLGVILVQIITRGTPSEESMSVILLASISAGTILYIVFMEIIHRPRGISGLTQLGALTLGFALMHVISQFFQD